MCEHCWSQYAERLVFDMMAHCQISAGANQAAGALLQIQGMGKVTVED